MTNSKLAYRVQLMPGRLIKKIFCRFIASIILMALVSSTKVFAEPSCQSEYLKSQSVLRLKREQIATDQQVSKIFVTMVGFSFGVPGMLLSTPAIYSFMTNENDFTETYGYMEGAIDGLGLEYSIFLDNINRIDPQITQEKISQILTEHFLNVEVCKKKLFSSVEQVNEYILKKLNIFERYQSMLQEDREDIDYDWFLD